MSVDVLSHFSDLDELVQVIYQGFERFVFLSKLEARSWTVHVGLMGTEGRWWRGSRSAGDILQLVGTKSSETVVETFAGQLANAVRAGDLHVDGWSSEKGAETNLILGSAKNQVRIPLMELSQQEGAAYATSVIFEIAKEAQARKCQLHPSHNAPLAETTHYSKPAQGIKSSASPPAPRASTSKTSHADAEGVGKVRAESKALKSEPAKMQTRKEAIPVDPKPMNRPPKGASLANPSKRARKYQELEFASDDDD